MINARLCKKVRLAFSYASLRHFDFPNCKTETSKCFKCELETNNKTNKQTNKQIRSLKNLRLRGSLVKIKTVRHT